MMLYGVFRIIFWAIVFVLSLFLIFKKSKMVRKKLAVILILISCMVLDSVSGMFPVENLFINFKSPENVFNYYQNGKVDDVITGVDSCMVIYSTGSHPGGHFIVPKSAKGYKIPSLLSVNNVLHKFDSDGDFRVYRVTGTQDYYIVATTVSNEKELNIVDSNNKELKSIIVKNGNADSKIVLIYSYVKGFTNDYYILINGEKITITN